MREPIGQEPTKPDVIEADRKQDADIEPSEDLQNEAVEASNERELDLPEVSESVLAAEQATDTEANPDDSGTIELIATLIMPAPEPVQSPATTAQGETGDPEAMTTAKHLYSEAAL